MTTSTTTRYANSVRGGAGSLGGRRLPLLALALLVALAPACSQPGTGEPEAPAPAEQTTEQPTAAESTASEPGDGEATPPEDVDEATSATPDIQTVTASELAGIFAQPDGKPMLVNFWATWCKPCIEEKPELIAFYNDTHEDIRFVSVTLMTDLENSTRPFLEKNPVPYTVFFTNDGPDAVRAALPWDTEWDGGLLPATFALTGDGEVAAQWFDAVTADQLKAAFDTG